jgi:hypothetical protein
MAGNTFKWPGNSNGIGDPNDADGAANRLIEQDGSVVPAGTPPGDNDTAILNSGPGDFFLSCPQRSAASPSCSTGHRPR